MRGFESLNAAYAAGRGHGRSRGEASAPNLTRDIRGEIRLEEQAIGVGADALADAVQCANEQLEPPVA